MAMPENILMAVDMIGIAGLSCFIYVILRYIYRFQATYSFQGWKLYVKILKILHI